MRTLAHSHAHSYSHSQLLSHSLLRSYTATPIYAHAHTRAHAQVGFVDCTNALRWCLQLQEALLEADWPESILTLKDATLQHWTGPEPLVVQDLDNAAHRAGFGGPRQYLWRGLRVAMGIHVGAAFCSEEPSTGQMTIVGPMVREASALASKATGGHILASAATLEAIGDAWSDVGDPFVRDAGVHCGQRVYHVLPMALQARKAHNAPVIRQETELEEDEGPEEAPEEVADLELVSYIRMPDPLGSLSPESATPTPELGNPRSGPDLATLPSWFLERTNSRCIGATGMSEGDGRAYSVGPAGPRVDSVPATPVGTTRGRGPDLSAGTAGDSGRDVAPSGGLCSPDLVSVEGDPSVKMASSLRSTPSPLSSSSKVCRRGLMPLCLCSRVRPAVHWCTTPPPSASS